MPTGDISELLWVRELGPEPHILRLVTLLLTLRGKGLRVPGLQLVSGLKEPLLFGLSVCLHMFLTQSDLSSLLLGSFGENTEAPSLQSG